MGIEFKNVHKHFGQKKVLQGVDLVFPENQVTVLIGPSGCGKSTTLRLILRLLDPSDGQVLVDDRNIQEYTKKDLDDYRSQIGMVFQAAALFDSMTVWENVGFQFIENTKMSRSKIKALAEEKLKLVGLDGSADLYPAELSGGMQKRVGIARAIAQNPKILLYDEPTTGLDPITSTIIEDLIKGLQRQSGGISIVVTHQLSTIFRASDTIAMFYEGRVLETGTPEEMKNSSNKLVTDFLEGNVEENVDSI